MILPVVLHFGTRNDLVVTFRLVVVVVVLHIGSYVCASNELVYLMHYVYTDAA